MPDTLFKTGYDQLVTRLGQITGLRVFDDPRNINVPCVVVEAPSIMMATNVVADMQFRVVIVGQGTGDRKTDAQGKQGIQRIGRHQTIRYSTNRAPCFGKNAGQPPPYP